MSLRLHELNPRFERPRLGPAGWLVMVLLLLALLASLGGFLGRIGYPWELLTHFRLQIAAGAVLIAILALGVESVRRWAMAGAAIIAAINCAAIALALSARAPALEGEGALRILWAHVDENPVALWAAAGLSRVEEPDVIALTALPAQAPLTALFPGFDCVEGPAEASRYAVAVLSRAPCAPRGPQIGGPWPYAAQRARLTNELAVIAAHAPRPIDWRAVMSAPMGWRDAGRVDLRDAVITAASDAVWGDPPAVLVGDFNAAPWSPRMAQLAGRDLRHADCGAPWRATWPTDIGLLGLPMDQVYLTTGLAARCRIAASIGAPHRPLIVDVGPARGS